MHSPTDELVRFHHGQRNFAAANEPKLFWELRGDHNNPLADTKHFIAGMEKLLTLIEAGRTSRSGGTDSDPPPISPGAKTN
jgi:hypothetical protein